MLALLAIGLIVVLPKSSNADPSAIAPGGGTPDFVYPASVPGGKNLIQISNMPRLYPSIPDYPLALHVPESAWPIVVGDKGSVVTMAQRMLNVRGQKVPIDGQYGTQTRDALWNEGCLSVQPDKMGVTTDEFYASDFLRLATWETPLLTGSLKVHLYK